MSYFIRALDAHETFGPFASRQWCHGYASAHKLNSYCIVTDRHLQNEEHLTESLRLVPLEWRGFNNPRNLPAIPVYVFEHQNKHGGITGACSPTDNGWDNLLMAIGFTVYWFKPDRVTIGQFD